MSFSIKSFFTRAITKSVQDVMRGLVGPVTILGPTLGNNKQRAKHDQIALYTQWVYNAANKNAAAVASGRLRLFATRASGEHKAGQRFGKSIGAPVKKLEMMRLKERGNHPQLITATEIEEIFEHPFLDMFQNVNDFNNQFETMELMKLFLDLAGDNYWYIEKDPVLDIPNQFWTLRPDLVTIVPDKTKFIKGYLYGAVNRHRVPFRPDQIVHFKLQNPLNPWYGMSRVAGAQAAVIGYNRMESYETALTENSAIPATVIKYNKGQIDSKKRRELTNEWNSLMQGISKTGGTFVADESFDVETLGLPPKELSYLQGRTWRFKEIVSAFGQTAALYDEKANRANIEGAIFLWEKYEIDPSLKRIEQKINEKLIPMYKEPRLFVAFDPIIQRDRVEDRADEKMLLEYGYPLNKILQKHDMEPIEGADVGYIRNTLVPLGSVPVITQQEPNSKTSVRKIASQDHAGGHTHIKGCACHLHINKDGTIDRDLSGGANGPLTVTEEEINAAIRSVFEMQLVLALRETGKAELADFAWVASESWAQEIVDLVRGAIKEEVIIGGIDGSRKIGVELTDFIERPNVQAAIQSHAYEFARAIGEESHRKLQNAMSVGLANGESIDQLSQRIGTIYEGWMDWRGERIARTESARALMLGKEQAWKESGVVAAKIWDAAGDACPFCLQMNGKIIELGEAYFTVDGPDQTVAFEGKEITLPHNYTDVAGPPLHPNCRCDLQPQLLEL